MPENKTKSNPLSYANYVRSPFPLPEGHRKLLLHVCCVVCAGEIIEELKASDIDFDVFFSNSNIHPEDEYALRLKSLLDFCDKMNVTVIEDTYDVKEWETKAGVLGPGREGSPRCEECFRLRLDHTFSYAQKNGYDLVATTLGISRWKNLKLIDQVGFDTAKSYDGVSYWDRNWRKKGGGQRMYEVAKAHSFFMQSYCGCIYSEKYRKPTQSEE